MKDSYSIDEIQLTLTEAKRLAEDINNLSSGGPGDEFTLFHHLLSVTGGCYNMILVEYKKRREFNLP